MTLDELKNKLIEINKEIGHDPEVSHECADEILLAYINDEKVSDLFYEIKKWYA